MEDFKNQWRFNQHRVFTYIFIAVFGYLVGQISPSYFNAIYVVKAQSGVITPKSTLTALKTPFLDNQTRIRLKAEELCEEYGLGEYCWKDLVGIAWREDNTFSCTAVGDGGYSFGCFQINTMPNANPDVSRLEAEDINFATTWTLDNLIEHGYPEYRSYAIRRHNGNPNIAKTKKYLDSINEYIIKNL